MKRKTLAVSMLSAILASTCLGVVSAKQTQVIELSTKDPGSTVATIRVSGRSLSLEASDSAESTLFTDDAVITINNKDRTYRVQSIADLKANVSRKAAELGNPVGEVGPAQRIGFKLTEETETISGFKARKLIKTSKGEPEAQFWVSSELLPPNLRALGESIKSMLPETYWDRVGGNLSMVEIIVLFGVPLRITFDQQIYSARVIESSGSPLQVPADYRKLGK